MHTADQADGTERPRRVQRTGDPDQPITIVDDDGDRAPEYDPFLRHRARDLDARELHFVAVALLVFQDYVWAEPGRCDLRAESVAFAAQLVPTCGNGLADRLLAHVTDYLDFCAHRDLVHALFLASSDDFDELLTRATTGARRAVADTRPASGRTDQPEDEDPTLTRWPRCPPCCPDTRDQ